MVRNYYNFASPNVGDVHPDLARERLRCPFDQEEITVLLDGSREKTQRRRELINFVLKSEAASQVNMPAVECMSASERYEYDLKIANQLIKLSRTYSDGETTGDSIRDLLTVVGGLFLPDGNPFLLHFAMFIPSLMAQCSDEQVYEWMVKAWNMEIIGAYAQTELGHGTYLKGLETTATYDPSTQEFVLDSPSLSAYKWWPGSMGKTATHALVMANLVTPDGVKRGPHPFIVQLRDAETHRTVPGVKVGVIGAKLGMHSTDNGFLGFDKHRIPRSNMLMKNSQVTESGRYLKPARPQLNYSTMVMVRCAIAIDVAMQLRKAATIAIRYSAVRRQGEIVPGGGEVQVLEYLPQQQKLFPALSLCFGLAFAAQTLWERYEENVGAQDKGDLSLLPRLHALSCGLKALSTEECSKHADILRRACGGHGYMASSNLPRIWGLVTAAATYEGENTVLLLQAARSLVKSDSQTKNPRTSIPANPHLSETYPALFDIVARGKIAHAIQRLRQEELRHKNKSLAWNAASVALTEAALAQTRSFVVAEFERKLKDGMSNGVRSVLERLFRLMCLSWMLGEARGDFAVHAGVTGNDLDALEVIRDRLLGQIRPVAVCIVDAFDFPDEGLRSTLGSYDGRAYERLFEAAMEHPLNKVDVARGIAEYVKPLAKSML